MNGFLAWIQPVSGDAPNPNPPGIWGGAGQPFPTPPIANVPPIFNPNPPQPPGIWGGGNEPFPTPPIHIPNPNPPGIWPSPGIPAHPIVIPNPPDSKPPGGGETGSPTNPIELPPNADLGNGFWKQAYFPEIDGWMWVWVPVVPSTPTVNPLKKK